MLIAVIVSGFLGAVATRSIVAEADAHRQDLPDRWYSPVCPECTGSLGLLLTTCRENQHPQRSANIFILLASIALSAALPLATPSPWVLPAFLVFLWVMILLTVTDLDTKLIPNRILGPATIVGVVLLVGGHLVDPSAGHLITAAVGGAAYFAVMLVLALIVRGGLGFGDVKLAFIIGVFSGYLGAGHVVVAGVGAFLIGGTTALVLLVSRRSGRKDAIPFGPFMTSAAIIAVFFGQAIVDWYLR